MYPNFHCLSKQLRFIFGSLFFEGKQFLQASAVLAFLDKERERKTVHPSESFFLKLRYHNIIASFVGKFT